MAKQHWGSDGMNLSVGIFVRLASVAVLTLMLVWILKDLKGFAWGPIDGNTTKLFNWHILLMVMGFPVIMTQIVLGESCKLEGSRSVLVQIALQGCAFLCLVGAVTAVFTSHIYHVPPFSNLQTAHSWFGIITLTFFAVQFLLGLFLPLSTGISSTTKMKSMEAYGHLKASAYFLGLATVTAGIVEKMTFLEEGSKDELSAAASVLMLPKVTILLLALIALSVFYLVTYQKPTRSSITVPETEALLEEPMESGP